MASTEGGVDIEEVAETNPEAIHKAWVDPLDGLQDEQKSTLADSLGLSGHAHACFVEMIGSLASIFVDRDCSMIEINPLVRTEDGTMVALDAKISFDDNASFRHPWRAELRDLSEESDIEIRAHEHGLSYVELEGNIGFGIILEDPRLDGILVNVFGGIIRCDMVARSIIEASEEIGLNVPLVVRFSGTNHSEGNQVLDDCNLDVVTASTLSEAGAAIVKLIGGASQ
jgi:succinyl-CoA synthetase beta subunit